MDAVKYVEAKKNGQASVIKHGTSTLLVAYDQDKMPRFEQGFQRSDLVLMLDAALKADQTENVAALDELIADVDAVLK